MDGTGAGIRYPWDTPPAPGSTDAMAQDKQATWGGRFSEWPSALMQRFGIKDDLHGWERNFWCRQTRFRKLEQ